MRTVNALGESRKSPKGDVFTKAKRSDIMSRIQGRNTGPERRIRSLLHRLGYRFRLHRRELPGSPDIVLPAYRTVVLVHGCFWHQHLCRDGRPPKTNQGFWLPKFLSNKRRDRRVRRQLRKLGWQVVVVWECHLSKKKIVRLTEKLITTLKKTNDKD